MNSKSSFAKTFWVLWACVSPDVTTHDLVLIYLVLDNKG